MSDRKKATRNKMKTETAVCSPRTLFPSYPPPLHCFDWKQTTNRVSRSHTEHCETARGDWPFPPLLHSIFWVWLWLSFSSSPARVFMIIIDAGTDATKSLLEGCIHISSDVCKTEGMKKIFASLSNYPPDSFTKVRSCLDQRLRQLLTDEKRDEKVRIDRFVHGGIRRIGRRNP